MPNLWLVLPAAGIGSRFGGETPKQYMFVAGKRVLQHVVERLDASAVFRGAVIVVHAQDTLISECHFEVSMPIFYTHGGGERMDSVLAGLNALPPDAQDTDWVLVHDVARPCVTVTQIRDLIQHVLHTQTGGVLAIKARDTLKEAYTNGKQQVCVAQTLDRNKIWQIQTPQMFRLGALKDALKRVIAANIVVTDEAAAMEFSGVDVMLVQGGSNNIKLTYAEDVMLIDAIIASQHA